MFPTTLGITLLGIGLLFWLTAGTISVKRTSGFRGMRDRPQRWIHLVALVLALTTDLITSLLVRSGYELPHIVTHASGIFLMVAVLALLRIRGNPLPMRMVNRSSNEE